MFKFSPINLEGKSIMTFIPFLRNLYLYFLKKSFKHHGIILLPLSHFVQFKELCNFIKGMPEPMSLLKQRSLSKLLKLNV